MSFDNCCSFTCRGAYDNKTVPGSKPYEDGVKLTVRNLPHNC